MNAPRKKATAKAAPDPGAPSFSGVSYDDALARARSLAPALRERAARSESERIMLPETLADLHASGLLRVLQPKRWGGMELDYVAYVEIPRELARGCASTGWNTANLLIHHWMLALYDERAQEEVWGRNPEALIASGIAYPQGQGRAVEGGFVVSGRWNFSSGVNVSDWNMLAVTVRDGDKVVDHRMCLLHKSEYEVVDDWQVLGMRSTGSMTVVAKDVFVPAHRALCMYEARGGDRFPGARGNPNPVYRVPLSTLGSHGIGGVAVGNAQAALELSIEVVKARSTNYTGLKMRDFQAVQLRIGAAGARIDAARQVLRNDCLEGQEIANRNVIAEPEHKLRFKRNLAYAVSLCTEAVDMLHAMAGANGIYDGYPIQRIFRDAHALAGHFSFSTDAQYSTWGLAALGGEIVNPTL
ncbi:MAG TPA: acyl-CoA dehydrogenase family protein [Burkholderiales bacterium]|nr:acyl-CoA dehydrogenase family protein [Burkholderiales bacterium]